MRRLFYVIVLLVLAGTQHASANIYSDAAFSYQLLNEANLSSYNLLPQSQMRVEKALVYIQYIIQASKVVRYHGHDTYCSDAERHAKVECFGAGNMKCDKIAQMDGNSCDVFVDGSK